MSLLFPYSNYACVMDVHATVPVLIKHRDQWASTDDVTEQAPRSVVSNRLLIEIARDEGGDLRRAADGDPPALLRRILDDPSLLTPPRKGRKKAVWRSNRAGS